MKNTSFDRNNPFHLVAQYVKENIRSFSLILILSLLLGGLPVLSITLVKSITNIITNSTDFKLIIRYGGALLFAIVLTEIIKFRYNIITQGECSNIVSFVRNILFEKIQKISYPILQNLNNKDVMNQVTEEAESFRKGLSALFSLTTNLIVVVSLSTISIIMDSQSAVPSILLIIISSRIIYNSQKKIRSISAHIEKSNTNVNEVLLESLNAFKEIKIYQKEQKMLNRFEKHQNQVKLESFKSIDIRSRLFLYFAILELVAVSMLFAFSGSRVLIGEITPGEFLGFVFGISAISTPMFKVFLSVTNIKSFLGTTSSTMGTLNLSDEFLNKKSMSIEKIKNIEFKDVYFKYSRNKKNTINNISFKIKTGDVIALIGKNGAGKSTLLNLLTCFYRPSSGKILINNTSSMRFSLEEIRSKISIAPQLPVLYPGTILENIKLGNINRESSQFSKIFFKYNLEKLLFPMNVNEKIHIGQDGSKLSGGQKQKISIARAIVKDSDIIILDEPTSALDQEQRNSFSKMLSSWSKDKIIFIVTHNLSVLPKNARRFIISNGLLYEDSGEIYDSFTQDQFL